MKAARVIVLIVAVGAGGVAALLAGRSDPTPPPAPVAAPPPVVQIETTEILVAQRDIPIGQSIGPQDLQWQIWPANAASPSFIRKTDRPDAIQQLTASIARTPFAGGEPIREAKLIKANGSGFMAAVLPAGMRALSTDISPETGAGGFILPNDRVDVLLTRRTPESEKASGGESHSSETILTNIRVLAIDQAIEEKNGTKVVVGKTATLELTPGQAETLALSRQLGSLSLALRSLADANEIKSASGDEEDPRSGARRLNTVKFGVSTSTVAK
jgi:pilus assembly protein CpaB